ncbi:Nin one binding Zn-ribbon like-domain-containing protein [Collybia nuda]|uniref:20S-pre-rRNA D-site endonuclease NOB1 n=1 Tax=Collybia nuda TaxID=64659 RepID=A0A9P5YBZ6_9AGAR|nr:Nin one binding Zn-ribbon like-domain-containing protein [Collybia nuda]
METPQPPRCKNLVLDAGPLLSLSPLRGLAETYLTVPQVLAELKDKRAREHFERLGLISGVKIEVRTPDAASLAHVIQWAKKTGDYSVLSHPDLCVLALTHLLHEEGKEARGKTLLEDHPIDIETQPEINLVEAKVITVDVTEQLKDLNIDGAEEGLEDVPEGGTREGSTQENENLEPLEVEIVPIPDDRPQPQHPTPLPSRLSPSPVYDDPSDSDDGEGEWITPSNVGLHKSRALDLLPEAGAKRDRKTDEVIDAGCMTADFAMQNVLLQMGLNLVGVEGKRIEKVKSWVLRCHACFKICKDASKKFCPSCGNPTLLRASVTVSAPNASSDTPAMQVHLKPNFQYKIRGTKYSIPAPKPGSAKTGAGVGLILREDQVEYMRAKKQADGKREREEAKMLKGILGRGVDGNMGVTGVGSWMDPDWVPEMISAGAGGKGRTMRNSGMDGDLPQIGYGKKNPNEKRRRK